MNNGVMCALAFTLGGAVGAAVTWKLIKTKYEQIAREEIESVKDVYSRKNDQPDECVEELENPENLEQYAAELAAKKAMNKPGIMEYADKLKENGYTDYSKSGNTAKEEVADVKKPYVISPEEFGDNDDYETVSLTYFADDVLADDMNVPVEDVENTVGMASLETFGEYEDDSVFVRNEEMKIDYEILLDERNYSDLPDSK